jgi:hypothetical protein
MTGGFSKEFKKIVAGSRKIALELGYDHISTIHFLLADCRLRNVYSIHDFAFENEEAFEEFYDALRLGNPAASEYDLPLSMEAEKTVKKAFKLWYRSDYYDDYVEPYHFFLAAATFPDSLFSKAFNANSNLFDELEAYYIRIGQTSPKKIHKSWMEKISRKVSYQWYRRRFEI